jgi:hypothetical protein
VTQSDAAESQIRYVLEQNAARLAAEGYTQDELIARLSELAAATWTPPDRESASVDAAAESLSTGAKEAFLRLGISCGLLVRSDAGMLRFRDAWLHGYLAARGLVHLLGGEYSDRGLTRDNAVWQLEQIGSPAIPVMLAALAVKDDAVGLGAAVVLRNLGPAAVPAVVNALASGNKRVRRWATGALSSLENANAALQVLLRVLEEDEDPLVLAGAALALGMSGNPEAEPGLIAALRHSDPMVRTVTRQALERFDSPRARRALDHLERPTPRSDPHARTPAATRAADELDRRVRVPAPDSPRIFISYAKEDIRLADEIRRLLTLADFDPWMDSAGLLAGDPWEARLAEVLRTSDFVIALLSEHTAGGYQETELRIAANSRPGGRDASVPFVLPCALGRLLRGNLQDVIPEGFDPDAVIRFWNVQADWRQLHEALYSSACATGLSPPVLLRSKPGTDFDEAAATPMIVRRNFFDASRNNTGRPPAASLTTSLNGAIVEDWATGRAWTRACAAPLPYLGQRRAGMVGSTANSQRLGGASDWRLPTLEEAMSLMTGEENARGLFISPHFSDDGYVVTCDAQVGGGGSFVWVAAYAQGDCLQVPADAPVAVRLVRTNWEHLR